MEIIGYYGNNSCFWGNPISEKAEIVDQVMVRDDKEQIMLLPPQTYFDRTQIECVNVVSVEIKGNDIVFNDGTSHYHFAFRKGDHNRDPYDWFDHYAVSENGEMKEIVLSTDNLRRALVLLSQVKEEMPSYHLFNLYFDIKRKLAIKEVDPDYQKMKGKVKEYDGKFRLEGRFANLSQSTLKQLAALIDKHAQLADPTKCSRRIEPLALPFLYQEKVDAGIDFPPGNLQYATIAFYGEKIMVPEFYHEIVGHGTQHCLSKEFGQELEALHAKATSLSVLQVTADYIGPERVYDVDNGFYIVKQNSILRLFSEYTYLKRDPEYPQFEGIGHPQDGWEELQASGIAILKSFKNEFMINYQSLPPEEKLLARQIAEKVLISIKEDPKSVFNY